MMMSFQRIKLIDVFVMAIIHCGLFFLFAHYHYEYSSNRDHDRQAVRSNDHHAYRHGRHDRILDQNHLFREQWNRFVKRRKSSHHLMKFNPTSPFSALRLPRTTIVYEPSYPKLTRLHEFPTRASEKEMAKHDRYIVHSILYTESLSNEYLQKHWKVPDNRKRAGPWKFDKKVCVNVRVKNGEIPYLNALIMTLMGGHVQGEESETLNRAVAIGHRLLSYMDLNLLLKKQRGFQDFQTQDIKEEEDKIQQGKVGDKDLDDYDDVRRKIFNLDFVHVHYSTPQNHHDTQTIGAPSQTPTSRRLDRIQDTLDSAHICVESELPWCLMMEEHTVVSIDFLNSLKRFVIAPLESFAASHRIGTESDGEVFRRMKKMSVISLFSSYNSETKSVMRVHDVNYSKHQYEKDRGKINSERKALDMDEYEFQYELYPIDDGYGDDADSVLQGGLGTAMLFHTSMVKSDLIPMLERLKRAEQRRIYWGAIKSALGISHPSQDYLDVEREFSLATGIKRYRVEPSLVNRIGFYDQDFVSRGDESRLGITNWLTDPRFVFEPGYYWEGIDEYCEMEDGTWIWDGLHDHRRKSCCKEEFANDEKCVQQD